MFFDLCSKFLSFAVSVAAILAGMSVLLLVALALPKTFLRESAQTARALSGLCRRQPVALGVFVLFAVVLSLHVGGKGERSPLAIFPGGFLSSPSFCGVPPTVSGLPVNAPYGAVPYEAFSNLHVSAFSATTTNVCLSASWHPLTNGVAVLDVYSSTNLLDRGWPPKAEVEVNAADTNAVFTLPLDWFGTPAALFLRLGSRFDFGGDGLPDAFEKWTCETDATARDSDSDGLSDGEELRLGTDPLLDDRDGELLTASTNRLLRPYLIACGNSLPWGLRRYNGHFETPRWDASWETYPDEAVWEAWDCPPANRFLKAYQGGRPATAAKRPGFAITSLGQFILLILEIMSSCFQIPCRWF